MKLNKQQIYILELIRSKRAKSFLDLSLNLIENKKTTYSSNYFGIINVKQGDTCYEIKDEEHAILIMAKCFSFLKSLDKREILSLNNTKIEKKPPVYVNNNNVLSHFIKQLKDLSVYIIIFDEDLEEFIDNDYKTPDEIELIRERESRVNSEKWTRKIAIFSIIASILTSFFSLFFNYYTYTNKRIVEIENYQPLKQPIEIRINDQDLEKIQNLINSKNIKIKK